MARLLADENFPAPVQSELRQCGHDVAQLSDVGLDLRFSSDEEILAAASSSGRTLLTLDRGLSQLSSKIPDPPGIIVCTFATDFVGMALQINEIVSATERMKGRVVQVGRRKTSS
jgi:predicted nuclease of predicted toxin-antitoxin system